MRDRFGRLKAWGQDHPFLTAVIVLLAIVIPNQFRAEMIASEAHDAAIEAEETAAQLRKTELREEAEEAQEALLSCQTRNTFQQNTRTKFNRFIDAVEVAFVSQADDPQRAEAVRIFTAQLRESVDTGPEDEDRDCNGDGVFDHVDYLP